MVPQVSPVAVRLVLVVKLIMVHGPLELVARSSLYQLAPVTEFQLTLMLVLVGEPALRPVGEGALGHVVVDLDTVDDAELKVVDRGEPSPLALTLK